MTRSNRAINRLLLALVGLLLLVAGAYIANNSYPVVELARIPTPTITGLWIVAAAALVVVVLALLWVVSRGRGRTRTLIRRDSEEGAASIQTRVVADLISEDLARLPDVVGVSATAFQVRRETVLELRVTTRSGADLRIVVDSVERAVAQLDDVLETRIPVLLHVASGVRAGFARQQRVR